MTLDKHFDNNLEPLVVAIDQLLATKKAHILDGLAALAILLGKTVGDFDKGCALEQLLHEFSKEICQIRIDQIQRESN